MVVGIWDFIFYWVYTCYLLRMIAASALIVEINRLTLAWDYRLIMVSASVRVVHHVLQEHFYYFCLYDNLVVIALLV